MEGPVLLSLLTQCDFISAGYCGRLRLDEPQRKITGVTTTSLNVVVPTGPHHPFLGSHCSSSFAFLA